MSIGYEGSALGVKELEFTDGNFENSSDEKRMEIISHHLKFFENILDYNIANHIGFYSINPKLIDFGRDIQNVGPWWETFEYELHQLGEKIRDARIRICMDLENSTMFSLMNEEDYSEASNDFLNQVKIFNALKLGTEHKIIIQIVAIDDEKKEGLERFKKLFNGLDKAVKNRLALRNDESHYNILEMINLGETLSLPVVFHKRNHEVNPPTQKKEELEWINECKKTWRENDGKQIVWYSEINVENQEEALAETIGIKAFLEFYGKLDSDADIILEVKDRNLSAVKCNNGIEEKKDIKSLELEWRKYKYSVLENSHQAYLQIRSLLKEKDKYPVVPFYMLIEKALKGKKREGFVNAAQHVWGYFKKCATENEKTNFLKMIEEYKSGKAEKEEIKESLWNLSVKYNMKYLLESYYFIL